MCATVLPMLVARTCVCCVGIKYVNFLEDDEIQFVSLLMQCSYSWLAGTVNVNDLPEGVISPSILTYHREILCKAYSIYFITHACTVDLSGICLSNMQLSDQQFFICYICCS